VLNSHDLQRFIREHSVAASLVPLDSPTPTVDRAAAAVGAVPDDIVKSLMFLVDGEPVVAIACGLGRVDTRAIASHFEVPRKRVRLADAPAVLETTGFEVGSLPPFGHLRALTTLIDRQVLGREEVFAGGGEVNALLRISPREIVRVSGGVVLPLVTRGGGDA
jgi:prolyl-tRNA editing enzyme YbaK/EbsC (Cys-tRNA(Pro) deacylase)